MLDVAETILVVSFSMLSLACISTNSLICYVIATRPTTDGASKYYVFSLAITDVLIGAVSIPVYIAVAIWPTQALQGLANFLNNTDMFFGVCSILHICLMAFDRLITVLKPIFHRVHMRQTSVALKLLLFPWILSGVLSLTVFLAPEFHLKMALVSTISIALPSTFIAVCYIIIFIAIRKRNSQFSEQDVVSSIQSEKRLLKMLVCILTVFLVCWLPFCVVNAKANSLIKTISYSSLVSIVHTVKFFQYLNSTCNPFVYAIFNPIFRSGVKDVLKKGFCCCYGTKRMPGKPEVQAANGNESNEPPGKSLSTECNTAM